MTEARKALVPRTRLRHVLGPLLVVALAATAGCGGDDDGGITKSEFIAKAEAICSDANRKETAFGVPPIDSRTAKRATFNQIGKAALGELRALPEPPAEIRADVEATFAALDRTLAAGDDLPRREKAYLDLSAAAGTAGFTECVGLMS